MPDLDYRLLGLLLVSLAALGWLGSLWWPRRLRTRRRAELRARELSAEQRSRIGALWPLFARLPEDLRQRLEGWMAVFLNEINFEACGELKAIREDMALLIAAQACLLLAGPGRDQFFPRLKSVLLYPQGYSAELQAGEGEVHGHRQNRLGESWQYGSVVLGWEEVKRGARDRDGFNLVLHEFAHQLDYDSGAADGAPNLEGFDGIRWQAVFRAAWEQFDQALAQGRASVLDDYAATNPAEFFAVVVETFFERGRALQHEFEELYAVLAEWFGCDPAQW